MQGQGHGSSRSMGTWDVAQTTTKGLKFDDKHYLLKYKVCIDVYMHAIMILQ